MKTPNDKLTTIIIQQNSCIDYVVEEGEDEDEVEGVYFFFFLSGRFIVKIRLASTGRSVLSIIFGNAFSRLANV